MDETERKADDARQLASLVDRDQHRLERMYDLNRRMINAHVEQTAAGFAETREGFAEMRTRFDQVAAGMEAIAALITERSPGSQ